MAFVCGRFTLRTPADIIKDVFGLEPLPGFQPRYNIAPTQPVAVVRQLDEGRRLEMLRWGLIPWWAQDASVGNRMINARAETVAAKPAYREPFEQRRCLIPADGFYEWQRLGNGRKQPFHFELCSSDAFAFAGIWDRWRDRTSGVVTESCALITTDANSVVSPIHDRMPVMLMPSAFGTWLERDAEPDRLQRLLRPIDAELLRAAPVSVLVNRPENDDARCLDRIAAPSPQPTLFD